MIKIIQIGLGPIGLQVVNYMTEREGLKVVAAVDNDPQKAGKPLNEIAASAPDVPVYASVSEAAQHVDADVAVVTTVSKLHQIEGLLAEIANEKLHIVSTCEELTYPWRSQTQTAQRIDESCKKNEVTCLSTGVNPGFLMDYLPAVLTSVCQRVDRIKVARLQNAAFRRGPFQQKIGAGLTPDEFERKKDSIAHVGLPESVWMIAEALNWDIDGVSETINPVVAETDISSEGVDVAAGFVLGVEQIATASLNGKEVINLEFRAAIGEAESQDVIEIEGNPSFRSVIPGGVNGDVATAAITVNAIRSALKMEAGLKTMLDIPAAAWFGTYGKPEMAKQAS